MFRRLDALTPALNCYSESGMWHLECGIWNLEFRLRACSALLLVSFFTAREDSPSGDLFSPQASGIWNLEFGLRLRRAVIQDRNLLFSWPTFFCPLFGRRINRRFARVNCLPKIVCLGLRLCCAVLSVLLLVRLFAAREDSPFEDLFSPQASGIWSLEFGLRLPRAVLRLWKLREHGESHSGCGHGAAL
jgi:hypothetical protein